MRHSGESASELAVLDGTPDCWPAAGTLSRTTPKPSATVFERKELNLIRDERDSILWLACEMIRRQPQTEGERRRCPFLRSSATLRIAPSVPQAKPHPALRRIPGHPGSVISEPDCAGPTALRPTPS
jgi:hypothetical protein